MKIYYPVCLDETGLSLPLVRYYPPTWTISCCGRILSTQQYDQLLRSYTIHPARRSVAAVGYYPPSWTISCCGRIYTLSKMISCCGRILSTQQDDQLLRSDTIHPARRSVAAVWYYPHIWTISCWVRILPTQLDDQLLKSDTNRPDGWSVDVVLYYQPS